MEKKKQAVILMGIHATGKSSFYIRNFFHSHVRISYDMLKDDEKEAMFTFYCLEANQNFVIDNVNLTKETRSKYIGVAQDNFEVVGYYFESKIKDAIRRNRKRSHREKVADECILRSYNELEIPSYNEGFDKLYYVRITKDKFQVKSWTRGM